MHLPLLSRFRNLPNWKTLLHQAGNKGIVDNIPFILYCAFLTLLYITINHYAENAIRDLNATAAELKEDRWRYIDEQSRFMFITKESQLDSGAQRIGLEKATIPPYKIQIKTQP
ncbi:MAG TPA: FtsL-like putative cell division protein [Chitinophagaceae bacterium]|nr:FtsL-like putative cell division protein [Chitinophagaceae bacterium]HNF72165.1 FtsL-like putative cell division protein [Chitinophagaceae bacterium]